MRAGWVLLSALFLASCQRAAGGFHTSEHGDYYVAPSGTAYQVSDGKLIELALPPKPKTLRFSLDIPSGGEDGFPAHLEGMARIGGGFRKLKLVQSLGDNGSKTPTPVQQARYVANIASGKTKIGSFNLWFYDADGFIASNTQVIQTASSGWTPVIGASGQPEELDYQSRDASDASEDREISTISPWWNPLDPMQGLNSVPPPPLNIPDPTSAQSSGTGDGATANPQP